MFYLISDFGLDLLKEVSLNAALKPWEVASVSSLLKLDLAHKTDAVQAIENVHAAAFRTGLGNSLYVAPHRLGKISNADVIIYFMNYIIFKTFLNQL